MADHDDCRDALRAALARACAGAGIPGADMVISTARPLVSAPPGQWQPMSLTCPHGTQFWVEPTGEQRVKWAAAGTP